MIIAVCHLSLIDREKIPSILFLLILYPGMKWVLLCYRLLTNGIELLGYQWLYAHKFFEWDWQSPWTWWFAAIAVDFIYYWIHRSAHGNKSSTTKNLGAFERKSLQGFSNDYPVSP